MSQWHGRVDAEDGPAGTRWHQALKPLEAKPSLVFLGFPCDLGVAANQGRAGAAEGPAALRLAMSNLPAWDGLEIADAGDVPVDSVASAQNDYSRRAAAVMQYGGLVCGLGGGHEISFASASALMLACPAGRLGILNLDAHFDLRKGESTSGTGFTEALAAAASRRSSLSYLAAGISRTSNTQALFDAAISSRVGWIEDHALSAWNWRDSLASIHTWLASVDHLYLSIDLDVLPASIAPGVSAPAARGVSLEVIEELTSVACQSGKLRIMDVAELNPAYDIDGRTARTAARLIWTAARAALP